MYMTPSYHYLLLLLIIHGPNPGLGPGVPGPSVRGAGVSSVRGTGARALGAVRPRGRGAVRPRGRGGRPPRDPQKGPSTWGGAGPGPGPGP